MAENITDLASDYSKFTKDELIDRIHELESLFLPGSRLQEKFRNKFDLTNHESNIAHFLIVFAGQFCSIDYLLDFLYPRPDMRDRGRGRDGRDLNVNLITTRISLIRRKLKPLGVKIESRHLIGYRISEEHARLVCAAVEIDFTKLKFNLNALRENKGLDIAI